MKYPLLLFFVVCLYGCGSPTVSYEDPHITITGNIELIERLGLEDGGSEYFKVKDQAGAEFELYISRRLDHEPEWGQVFAHAYMDKPGSVKLENQAAITKLLTSLKK